MAQRGPGRVVGQVRAKCPINFSLSRRDNKLKLIGHQTDPPPQAEPSELLKKSLNQPAKLTERVIAPGEAAEPRETQTKMVGAHEAGDE